MLLESPSATRGLPGTVTDFVENLDLTVASKYPVPEMGHLLGQSVLAGGKRLRPTLCFLMGGIFEIDFPTLIPYARVAEYVHSASLAHDDVLDMAELRRDHPTINALSSNSQAVLSGDFLVARVIKEMTRLGAVDLLHDMSEVMEHLVYGEWLQEGSRGDVKVSAERLRKIAEFKTASLLGWCCQVAPRLHAKKTGRMDEALVEECRQIGISLGIGFQLVDDVIDYDPDGEKDYGRDLKNGFINFVTWELLNSHPQLTPEIQDFLQGRRELSPQWHPEKVEAAVRRVRQRSVDELSYARRKLTGVIDRVLGSRQENNSSAQSLLELIDLMALRSV